MTPERNPYVGLRPFHTEDSLYFFGRDEQTSELLDVLHHHRFLGIVGSSGSGKSSLVRAGLLPALRGGFLVEDRDRWELVQMQPGDAPIENLAAALVDTFRAGDPGDAPVALAHAIRELQADAVIDFIAPLDRRTSVFILVDQFEELFAFRRMSGANASDATDVTITSTHSLPMNLVQAGESESESDSQLRSEAQLRAEAHAIKERARRKSESAEFVAMLMALAEQRDLPIYVALTMRTDFLGDCDLFFGFPQALNRGQYLVPRLTRQQLRRAIEGPARLMGARLSPRLVDEVLNELGDRSDRLPVLQHALLRTWERWAALATGDDPGPIELEHFTFVGGLELALHKDAEGALKGVEAQLTERIFRRLTDTDLNQRRIRSPARISTLVAAVEADRPSVESIVNRFAEQGRSFLRTSADGDPDDVRVDISHESLIRQWRRLRSWVDAEREARDRYKDLLERALEHQRGEAGLLPEQELKLYLLWLERARPTRAWARRYSNADEDFALVQQYLKRSADTNRARIRRTALMAGGLLGVGALAVFALVEWGNAREALREATALGLASEAMAVVRGEQNGAGAIAIQKLTAAHALAGRSPAVRYALSAALVALPGLTGALDAEEVTAAAFSADDSLLVQGHENGAVDVIETRTGAVRRQLGQHRSTVLGVAVSRDRSRIVSTGADSAVRLWDAVRGVELALPDTSDLHRIRHVTVALDETGSRLALAGEDSIFLWDMRDPIRPRRIGAQPARTYSLAFSHDNAWLYSGGPDGKLRRWRTESLQPAGTIAASRIALNAVAVSRDGARVAAGGDDQYVRVWRAEPFDSTGVERTGPSSSAIMRLQFGRDNESIAGVELLGAVRIWSHLKEVRAAFPSLVGEVRALAFDVTGTGVAVAGNDGTTWWQATPAKEMRFAEHLEARDSAQRLFAVAVDDSIVVTGGEDYSIRVYAQQSGRLLRTLKGHGAIVRGIAVSPGGSRIASASLDSTVRLWNVSDGREVARVPLPSKARAQSVAYSRDGSLLVTGLEDHSVRVWDARTLGELGMLVGHTERVLNVAISPDGKRIASSSSDSTVRLWDWPATGRSLQLLGHKGIVRSVSFSPDGALLASSSADGTVRVWDVKTGTLRGVPLTGHVGMVYSVAFSPTSSTRLVSGGVDGTVRLWQVPDPDASTAARQDMMLARLNVRTTSVYGVAFLPDGESVVSAGAGGTLRAWPVREALAKELCDKLRRPLAGASWRWSIGSDVDFADPCPVEGSR